MTCRALVAAAILAAGCGSHDDSSKKSAETTGADKGTKAAPAPTPAPTPTPAPADAGAKGTPAGATGALAPSTAHAAEPAPGGHDFTPQMRALDRVAACGETDAKLPDGIDATLVKRHCKQLEASIAEYKKAYLDKAIEFLGTIVPKSLPTTVVYPFGGGDLVTALATFPDATEITIVSLEQTGDPRVIDRLRGEDLAKGLDDNRKDIEFLFHAAFSKTVDLKALAKESLPGQLIFALVGLHVMGYEPVTLRFFHLDDKDGTIVYVTDEQLAPGYRPPVPEEEEDEATGDPDAPADKPADAPPGKAPKGKHGAKKPAPTAHPKKKHHRPAGAFNPFADMELTFRKAGDPAAPLRVYRHIAFNLDNDHFADDASLAKHLAAKGPFTAMTKASSYLLWYSSFTHIRDFLLGHMVFLISESTAPLPTAASAAGFEQITYGRFLGTVHAFEGLAQTPEMVKFFKDSPYQPCPVRFGYPDSAGHAHIVITRKK